MSDFGMALLSGISKSFTTLRMRDRKLKQIANRVRDGTDYSIANEYAIRTGELLSKAINENTQTLAFMSRELAAEVLTPILTADHDMVTEVTDIIQQNMNNADGFMLGVQTPAVDTDRINGFIDKVSSYADFSQARWVLGEPVVNYSQAVVDQAVRDNARASAKAGIKSYITRTAEKTRTIKGNPTCKWCAALEGTYEYIGNGSNIPHEVYQKHEGCRCELTFKRSTLRQNVWDHREVWSAEDADRQKKIVERLLVEKAAEERAQIQG